MKKIMFDDNYGLTQAVIELRKTNTRRVCKEFRTGGIIYAKDVESIGVYSDDNLVEFVMKDGSVKVSVPRYKVGEVVAVAQSYAYMANSGYLGRMIETSSTFKKEYCGAGWSNKMFVRAELMPHQIRITDIKVERLQDISDEDCMREGIFAGELKHEQNYSFISVPLPYGCYVPFTFTNANSDYLCEKYAFAALIDKIGGKGTWERNPFVCAYTFELFK